MDNTDSPLERYQRHSQACDAGIAAASAGMAEETLLAAYRKDYERRRTDWLLVRAAVERRMAELPRAKRRARRVLEEVSA